MAIFGEVNTVLGQIDSNKFGKAFSFIQKLQDSNSDEYKTLTNTKIDECTKIVLDENCFVLFQSYITKNKVDCLYESHKKYIDIQYIFEGEEIMEVENVTNLQISKEYDKSLDYAKYFQSNNASSLLIRKNELAIFYPNDAHMPCIKVDKNEQVIKAVFKIAV